MLTTQFGITGRLGGGYQHIKDIRTSTDDGQTFAAYQNEMSGSGYYAALTPGLIFLPVPKFGISATIGALSFNRTTTNNSGSSTVSGSISTGGYTSENNDFGARFGLGYLQFGGTYYFGR